MAYRVKLPPNRSRILRVPTPTAPPATATWPPPRIVGRRAKLRGKPRSRFLPLVGVDEGVAFTTKLDLQWSFAVASTVPVSTVTGDEQDAWGLGLEWAFLIDLDPADDVEGDP